MCFEEIQATIMFWVNGSPQNLSLKSNLFVLKFNWSSYEIFYTSLLLLRYYEIIAAQNGGELEQ